MTDTHTALSSDTHEPALIAEFLDETPLARSEPGEASTELTDFELEPPVEETCQPVPSAPGLSTVVPSLNPEPGSRSIPRQVIGLLVVRPLRGVAWCIRTLFGIASLILFLAIIAAIPVVQVLALGYLLAVEQQVARTGRLRDAFPLLDLAPRLGSIVLGIWLWAFPLRLLANAAADARLIDPGSPSDRMLNGLLAVLPVLVAIHVCLALARGGRLSCFFRPIKNARWLWAQVREGGYWSRAEQAVVTFVRGLRLRQHFWLGVRGYAGALMWLAIPSALFATARKTEGGPILVTLFGGVLLVVVLSWVPFLQAHFAAEDRWSAWFELGKVRTFYRHTPFAWVFTLLITLAFSLPLYLFKVAAPPRDAMWMAAIAFIVAIYPMRVLTGWAYFRARHRERKSYFLWRWACWLIWLPISFLFVFVLFFTQFIDAHGKLVLFEHPAFLLPAPF